jgi:hypothetical protein
MSKKAQKTGEANFKVGIFQEYFEAKKFTFQQEIDRIDFIITDDAGRHSQAKTEEKPRIFTNKTRINEIIKPCISPLFMVYWVKFTQGEAWLP